MSEEEKFAHKVSEKLEKCYIEGDALTSANCYSNKNIDPIMICRLLKKNFNKPIIFKRGKNNTYTFIMNNVSNY